MRAREPYRWNRHTNEVEDDPVPVTVDVEIAERRALTAGMTPRQLEAFHCRRARRLRALASRPDSRVATDLRATD